MHSFLDLFVYLIVVVVVVLPFRFSSQEFWRNSAPHLSIVELSTGSKEAEKEMNEALDSGDFEEIMKRITPQKLTECTTNCIEKSFEVRSYELGLSTPGAHYPERITGTLISSYLFLRLVILRFIFSCVKLSATTKNFKLCNIERS